MKKIIAISLVLAGCSKEVPVEIPLKLSPPPAECKADYRKAPRMTKFGTDRQWTAVEINKKWAAHEIERDAIDRGNAKRWAVCRVWINHIAKVAAK